MFLKYYGLSEQPFGVTPDPRFLYLSAAHREALASLYYGIEANRGFLGLIAQPGMGKTTLLFHLLSHLRARARTVFLFQTQCDSRELFRYLLRDLGLTPGPDMASMHQQLNQVIVDEARAGRRVVLVIDEAQNLKGSVLETVRLLTDFETSQHKLLQIILAGHSEFIATLLRPDLEQLKQRIATLSYLRPLNRQEIDGYIAYRLDKAGYQGAPLFTAGALEIIAQGSGGIPRNINHLCFNALSIACALRKKCVDREVAAEALEDRKFESHLRPAAPVPPVATPAPAPAPMRSVAAPRRWTRMRQALVLTAAVVVAAALGASAGLYAQRANWSPHLPAAIRSVVTGFVVSAPPAAAAPAAPAAKPEPSGPAPKSAAPRRDLVVVEPHQTLTDIGNLYLGEYNATVLARLRQLNPDLGDPDHLEVGQKIRLPIAVESQPGESRSSEVQQAASGNAP